MQSLLPLALVLACAVRSEPGAEGAELILPADPEAAALGGAPVPIPVGPGPAPPLDAPTAPDGLIVPTQVPQAELVGVVEKKPWSKTMQSWEAGGSDYFVIDVGDPADDADETILRPSSSVSWEALEALVGQRVRVQGLYLPDVVPEVDPMSQFPVGADGGPAPSGGGLQALQIVAEPEAAEP